MPNPSGPAEIDAYAAWAAGPLLSRVRRDVPFATRRRDATYLAGVSLGGWVSLELLVRAPETWGAWAGVQTAIGTWAAEGFAEKIAKATAKPRAMLVLTSTQDHWRASSEALARALRARAMPCDERTIPGPHDQPWLREAGTLETLMWLDRLRVGGRGGGDAPRGLPTRDVVRDRVHAARTIPVQGEQHGRGASPGTSRARVDSVLAASGPEVRTWAESTSVAEGVAGGSGSTPRST
jgi:pimeloyl-ACP methyl ester carboxylesterase